MHACTHTHTHVHTHTHTHTHNQYHVGKRSVLSADLMEEADSENQLISKWMLTSCQPLPHPRIVKHVYNHSAHTVTQIFFTSPPPSPPPHTPLSTHTQKHMCMSTTKGCESDSLWPCQGSAQQCQVTWSSPPL